MKELPVSIFKSYALKKVLGALLLFVVFVPDQINKPFFFSEN